MLREGERRARTWAVVPGSVSYGPGINTAAVLLSSYGNVPSERAANLIGMLLGMPVSAGFADLASERLSARLEDAGFDDAMQAALGEEPVLAADETPVNLLDPHAGLAAEDAGAPHVLVVRTPHRGLTWLRALGSRQAAVCYPSRRAGASLAASGRPGRDRGPCGRDGGRRHETSKSAPPSGDSPIRQ